MEPQGIKPEYRKPLADWIKRGFWHYGALRCEPRPWMTEEDSEGLDNRIRRFGQVYAKTILEVDSEVRGVIFPKLCENLLGLMQRGCPILDIVDLSLGCTSGAATLHDALQMVGVTGRDLDKLRKYAQEAAEIILRMLKPSPLGGSSLLHPDRLPENVWKQIRHVEYLPVPLMLLVKALDNYPQRSLSRKNEQFEKDRCLVLLYLLLKHFGYRFGYPTVSRLLKTMRHVRQIVVPGAEYLHSIAPVTVNRRSEKSKFNDPFRVSAVTKRVERFLKIQPQGTEKKLRKAVDVYLSDEFAEQRKRGKTLQSLFGQIWLKVSKHA